jgi:hypothetical protein
MKRPFLAGLLLGLVLALPALAQDAGHDAHDAHAAQDGHAAHDAPTGSPAFPAQRWTPDPPLSDGMQRVRAATAALAHGGHGHLDRAQVDNIAAELQSAVEAMFAQCKLEPEPDAALHPLLARVLGAATVLREHGFDAGALATLEQVLADYPRLFDDPAWSASQSD